MEKVRTEWMKNGLRSAYHNKIAYKACEISNDVLHEHQRGEAGWGEVIELGIETHNRRDDPNLPMGSSGLRRNALIFALTVVNTINII